MFRGKPDKLEQLGDDYAVNHTYKFWNNNKYSLYGINITIAWPLTDIEGERSILCSH